MLYDFTFHNPTKIHFGKDSLTHLNEELRNFGPNILLVYGGGSIKKYGLYDKVIAILKEEKKNVFELSNVTPNPKYTKLLEGVKICEEHKIDLILGVGGGSVIDLCKGVSVSIGLKDPFKKYWIDHEELKGTPIPVACILTMVGTGSEMNGGSVITDGDRKLKKGRVFPPIVYPKFAILNPEITYTVSEYQMLSGIFDTLSHLMEQYFSGDDTNVSDYLLEALMKALIDATPKAIANPKDYEARSNIMWIATLALNTLVGMSKEQDWEVHSIEHQLGAYTDCAHGMGLAAISIPYYKHIYKYGLPQFVKFAKNVWDVDSEGKSDEEVAIEGLDALEKYIKDSKMVTRLRDLGATEDMLKDIADSSDLGGAYKQIDHEEILEILKECY